MIKPEDRTKTLVYTKNNCVKCETTKRLLKSKGVDFDVVNIEESDHFDEYVTMLKGEAAAMAMPVVFPAKETGLPSWNDFLPNKITELVKALS